MSKMMATMFIFAGNNGSGKSTIRNLIIDRLGISVNIDPDVLARGIYSEKPEKARVSAGKKAIRLAKECIKNHLDFSIETTLSGGYAIRLIQEAKANNYEIIMFYIGLGDPQLNIARVAIRVQNGGHDVPSDDIKKRHYTSMKNLLQNMDLLDYLVVIDNKSLDGEIVLEAEIGRTEYVGSSIPDWALPIKSRLTALKTSREFN